MNGKKLLQLIHGSQLFRSAGVYTVSKIVNSAIPFLMLPILTRYLSPADYGIVAMFNLLLCFFSPFVGLSIHGAITVRYYKKKDTNYPRYIGNCFLLLLLSTLLVSIVTWLFAKPISMVSAFPAEWLWVAVAVSAGNFVVRVLLSLWQVEKKAAMFAIFQNLLTAFNFAVSIFLVVGLGRNWQGRVEAQFITTAVFMMVSIIILYRKKLLNFSFDRQSVSDAARFGVPLIPHELGSTLITQTDRLFIANMVGVAAAGVYTVGFQVGYIIEIFASSFNQAYSPWLFEQLAKDDNAIKYKIVKYTYFYFVFIFIFALVLALILPWGLKYFVGKDFQDAGKYTFWIAIGFSFSGMYYMVTNYIFYSGKTAVLARMTFITSLVNILLNYLLIKMNGAVGAAQASALAFLMSFLLTWHASAKVFKMPWSLRKDYIPLTKTIISNS